MTYTRQLLDIGSEDLALVGGKAANLGELANAGVAVPLAYFVTTDAYKAIVSQGQVREQVDGQLAKIDYENPASIEAQATEIRRVIVEAEIPADLLEELLSGYAALEAELGADVAVSVRSSATAEDLPGMSFAGQQDTYLYISGKDAVIDAIKRCWASLWTDRAIVYRHNRNFKHDEVFLAVVVQEMFPSEVSGVMFTANPVTSNPQEFFLNCSWGLGEAVVSGQVNPDQFIVQKDTYDFNNRQINDKKIMTAPDPRGQGSLEVPVPDDKRNVQSLPDDIIVELCKVGQTIEDHYEFPQDVEWGWANGRLVILQAREITGADLDFSEGLELWKPERAQKDTYDDNWVWSRAYSDEYQTGSSTPSFYSYLQKGMAHLKVRALRLAGVEEFEGYSSDEFFEFPYFRWYGARAYYNLTFERERTRLFVPPFARDDAALWAFPREQHDEIRNMPFDWNWFLGMLKNLQETQPEVSLLGTTQVIYDNLERWTDAEEAYWETVDLDSLNVEEIFAAQLESRGDTKFGLNVAMAFTVYVYFIPQGLQTVCEAWLEDKNGKVFGGLLGGLQSKTSEENIALWQLSRTVVNQPRLLKAIDEKSNEEFLSSLDDDEVGLAFKEEIAAFLKLYGQRGGAERDAIHKRWRHDPALLVDAMRPMLRLEETDSPEQHENRMRENMLKIKSESIAKLKGVAIDAGTMDEFGWLPALYELTGKTASDRAELFEWLANLVQDYTYYRDFERFYNDRSMCRWRDLYEAIGRRFVRNKVVECEEDAFYLSREEVLMADKGELTPSQIEKRVRTRRGVYDRYSQTEPPKFLQGWRAFDDEEMEEEGALVGIGASNGTVTGRARVCRELSDITKVEKSDILVTVATDPGWTTVFSIISGVVVETGGVVAHAVMISREYGLPCVSNVQRVCDRIEDGSIITVNGATGRVYLHEDDQLQEAG